MPPHLHPRSRMTTSLFTGTLAFCFLVVGAPHIFPCPVDNRAFADSADPDALSGKRRRKRIAKEESPDGVVDEERRKRNLVDDVWKEKPRRECPVPKPGGLIGQVLGLKGEGDEEALSVTIEVEKARRGNDSK